MVSVVMPIYNGQDTMRCAIESVRNQTYSDIQLIIVNDGSTDKTLEIIQKYAVSDERVRYFSQPNAGQAAARNFGLSKAEGEYVQFLDCDDTLESDAIETLVRQLSAHPKASFVLFGFNVYAGEQLLRTPNPGDGYFAAGSGYNSFRPVEKLMASPCNKLYRRNYIKVLFDEKMVFGEDSVFNYANLTNETEVVLCSRCLYNVQLGTENSVNKRYKKGKLSDVLMSRRLEEQVMSKLFPGDFDVERFRKNELSTVAFTVYMCSIKLAEDDAAEEMRIASSESTYLAELLKYTNSARLHDKLLLYPMKGKKYLAVIKRSKMLRIIRSLR